MASNTTPRTIADFKGAHDPDVIVPRKIRAALEQIAKGWPGALRIRRRVD